MLSNHTTSIYVCLKALNTEIKSKRETVESVLKDNDICVHSVKVRKPYTLCHLVLFPAFMFMFLYRIMKQILLLTHLV